MQARATTGSAAASWPSPRASPTARVSHRRKFSKEVDSHGNVQLSGSGALGDLLAGEIKAQDRISRVRADTFGYLQRSFPGVVSEVGRARSAPRSARRPWDALCRRTRTARSRSDASRASATGRRSSGCRCGGSRATRSEMPARFINKAGNDVTQAFLDYAAPSSAPCRWSAVSRA